MKIAAIVTSKYLRKEDFPSPALATIDHVEQQDIAAVGEAEKKAWCLFFREYEKPLVLNTTNTNRAIAICGTDDSDHWPGTQVVIYVDETIEFGGKIMGGIRLRAPKKATPKAAPPAPVVSKTFGLAELKDDLIEDEIEF